MKAAASFLALAALIQALIFVGGCGGDGVDRSATDKRVIVIGIDGMDPVQLGRLMDAGKMPVFSRLAARGAYMPLGTSIPPHSPVAWSNFITGQNPGGHGIFGFLRHDHRDFTVGTSTSQMEESSRFLGIPFGGGHVNRRKGKAFWEYLEDHGIPATVFRVPANFPPVGTSTRSFSGLGTPDLRGSNGEFTYFTDNPPGNADRFTGGTVVTVEVEDGVVRTELPGPPNLFRDDGAPVATPLTVYVDAESGVARIDVGESKVILRVGEWSGWVRIPFTFVPVLAGTSGIVRFYLKSLKPDFRLYTTAINVDPADPNVPLSSPSDAVRELCEQLGGFYTKGMPVDTKALTWRVLNEDEFLMQAMGVMHERERLLEYELNRFHGRTGFLFFYFTTVDLTNHMMWSASDPKHPDHRKGLSDQVKNAMATLYLEMDRVLGRVMKEVDDRTTLVVMSDHGFAPYYRQVHLNNWLVKQGFLALYGVKDIKGGNLKEDVDWLRTRAYAIGFNGVYLNLQGRERIGRVTDKTRGKVLDEIERKLLAWRDPDTHEAVIRRVYRADKVYSGPCVSEAPDLVIGYARGYRGSNETALGEFGDAVLMDNKETWSADHMMAAEEVPGILLVNRPVLKRSPTLVDLPVTILDLFGIPGPKTMVGSSLFRGSE